jgi:predicted dinucleotide-binding enzyme
VLARDPSDGKGGRHVLFVSGNDASANAAIVALLTSFRFEALDLGRTGEGGLLHQFGGPLSPQSFVSQAQGGSPGEMDLLGDYP